MHFKTFLFTLLCLLQFSVFAQDEQGKVTISEISIYEGVQVFPNPAALTDYVTVKYGFNDDEFNGNSYWIDFEHQGLVDVYRINGERAMNTIRLSNEAYMQDIPVSDLLSGAYFFVVRLDDRPPLNFKVVVL